MATGGQGAAHGSAKVGGIVRRRSELSTVREGGCDGAGCGRRGEEVAPGVQKLHTGRQSETKLVTVWTVWFEIRCSLLAQEVGVYGTCGEHGSLSESPVYRSKAIFLSVRDRSAFEDDAVFEIYGFFFANSYFGSDC